MTKLNKQGVRDLNYIGKRQAPAQDEAAEVRKHFVEPRAVEPLVPEIDEMLKVLAEECGETVQRVTKILRFGSSSKNPWTGKHNVELLEMEIGDIVAAFEVLCLSGFISFDRVNQHVLSKLAAFVVEEDPSRPRLLHMTPELRASLVTHLAKLKGLLDGR